MSLRVLLADESASIKKVFQLGLQDFAAEVKSVHSGVDVAQVAEAFQPDIIFADILLQKKNGYEVAEELKKHATLSSIPIVLMWSSFMELDRQKYEACGADGEIEKPFDVDAMRTLITNAVPKLKDQQLSSFLTFPSSISQEFVEEIKNQTAEAQSPMMDTGGAPVFDASAPQPLNTDTSIDTSGIAAGTAAEDLDDVSQSVFNQPEEDFNAELEEPKEEEYPVIENPFPGSETQVEYQNPVAPVVEMSADVGDEWQSQNLSDNQLAETDEPDEEEKADSFQTFELSGDDEKLQLDDFLYKPGQDKPDPEPEKVVEMPPQKNRRKKSTLEREGYISDVQEHSKDGSFNLANPGSETSRSGVQVDRDEVEAIVRAHAQEVIKLNIQEQLPKIIERIVREELDKLLREEIAKSDPEKS